MMDTSLMPIRSMEPKIMERLRKVFPEQDFTMERCPPVMSVDEFKVLTRQTPYIGLAFVGFNNDGEAGSMAQGLWNWKLIIVCRATGNFNRRIKGDAFDLGLDDIVDVAAVILHGVSFENIGLCSVTSSEVIYSEGMGKNAVLLAHVNFTIRTSMASGTLALETLEDFKGIDATWMMPEQIENETVKAEGENNA